jgi:hypothetical protein
MAPFRLPHDQNRLDWSLLQCSPVTRDVAWLRRHPYRVHFFDCSALVFLPFDRLYWQSPKRSWHLLDIIAGNSGRYSQGRGGLSRDDEPGRDWAKGATPRPRVGHALSGQRTRVTDFRLCKE